MGAKRLELGRRTWFMAVLNLTPDSFYAGSRCGNERELLTAAERALAAGADVLDLGAESTRPGAMPMPAAVEAERLLPVLRALRRRFPQALISADTRHAATAAQALDAGADIINDVGGLDDPGMLALLAAQGCGVVLMHHRGDFATMHRLPPLADPARAVRTGLEALLAKARSGGLDPQRCVLDPGFGFGKNLDENFPVLARLDELSGLGRPLLLGLSRKSFLRRSSEQGADERLTASLAATVAGVLAGAHVVRTHDVAATLEAARIADQVLAASGSPAAGL